MIINLNLMKRLINNSNNNLLIKYSGDANLTETVPCDNIKSDLEYVNAIIDRQSGREPTPDVKRFQTQLMYKKELCRMQKEE